MAFSKIRNLHIVKDSNEGTVFLSIFDKNITISFGFDVPIEYVCKCVEYLECLENTISNCIRNDAIRYYKKNKELLSEEKFENLKSASDIFQVIIPKTMIIKKSNADNEPTFVIVFSNKMDKTQLLMWEIGREMVRFKGKFIERGNLHRDLL